MARYRYSIGGSLDYQNPTYVKRKADDELYNALKNGEFCYVLNSRQMGKSSLRVKMAKKLKQEGFKCVSVDMTKISSYGSAEEWYGDLMFMLLQGLILDQKVNFELWLQECSYLSPLQKFNQFIETIILSQLQEKIIIFLDEIDSIIKIKFKDEFFAVIRSFYNQRSENQEYKRLTFCLLGVATPSDLIQDKTRTPFNIGQAIELKGFEFEEAQSSLTQGLREVVDNPEEILEEILHWTGGQPFLTQKLCKLVVEKAENRTPNIEQIVQAYIINNWESQDEPEHLKTIRDRILDNEKYFIDLLGLYQQILQDGKIEVDGSSTQLQLRLSGLVSKNQGRLEIYNKIYELVFNKNWVQDQLYKLCPYAQDLLIWLEHGKDPKYLLKGKRLREAEVWQQDKNLPSEHIDFIYKSQKKETKKNIFDIASVISFLMGISMMWISLSLRDATQKLKYSLKVIELEQNGVGALQQFKSDRGEIESLLSAMESSKGLKELSKDNPFDQQYLSVAHLFRLQQILDNIHEMNQFRSLKSLEFSPTKNNFLTVNKDGKLNFWNWSNQKLTKFQADPGVINDVTFSPDGKSLATAGNDGVIRLWSLSGQQLTSFKAYQGATNRIIFSPNGKYLAALGEDSQDSIVRWWDLSGQKLGEFKGDKDQVGNLNFSYDSKRLVLDLSMENKGYIIDVSGKILTKVAWIPSDSEIESTGLNITPNHQYLYRSGAGSGVLIWDWSGQQIAKLKGYHISFSPDGKYIATADDDKAYLWDLSGKQLREFKGHKFGVWGLSFSPDGKLLATGGKDGITNVWSLSGKKLVELRGHQGTVTGVSFSPDGKYIATGGSDLTIHVWDLSGQELVELKGHQEDVTDLFFSHDNKNLLSYGNDDTARLWNLSGNYLKNINKNDIKKWDYKSNSSVQVELENQEEGTVIIRDQFGEKKITLQDYDGEIVESTLSPDSQYIAITTRNGKVRIWNLSGQLLALWKVNFDPRNGITVKFSPDGQYLAIVGEDNKVVVWSVPQNLDELLERGCNWLSSYFANRPDGRERLKVCQ
ncbi:putative WD repeat-containing protein sll0163 [Planktothrix agardhii]|uniref:AAA-like domain-containing protein n=1 Tax=Planktothrix agardhii TaxID=1160 RepID=UPI0020A7F76A|nr:AAA-like domain-containing protein [Planktothrix agardhii]CAD5912538.1 putative WD repeat-containing protein sll0163 [Planktothrix agardhii]